MEGFLREIEHFIREEKGATAVEYAIIAAAIAAVIVAIVWTIGGKTSENFKSVNEKIK
ncbi:MAG: Flp family type IVb pilin [Desulfuromonas sp.]|uniref:Flp family type IVb pilin n=1 Tax=Desulfuromonas sp. TaxID=892 RepID=UPI000CA7E1BC|nr:Flp family type IVb pilin [Desulfuromonas sp.]PLX86245.1 MAG: Flp family type IVb pilin [Desulfuromonas sp.]